MMPRNLVLEIIRLFPAFEQEWDEGKSYGYNSGDFKLHTVFLSFAPKSNEFLKNAKPTQIKAFCSLINSLVLKGGDYENAVSTCFLEHASQLGVRKLLEPHLSPEAKKELR
jgi:hypothetical protein